MFLCICFMKLLKLPRELAGKDSLDTCPEKAKSLVSKTILCQRWEGFTYREFPFRHMQNMLPVLQK